MNRWKLLKDLPNHKAGDIGTPSFTWKGSAVFGEGENREVYSESFMRAHPDFFERESHLLRVLSLNLLPETVGPGDVQALQRLGVPHVLVASVRRVDTERATKRLERVRSQHAAGRGRDVGLHPSGLVVVGQVPAGLFEPAVVLVLGWPVLDWIPESSQTLLCFGASSHVASAAARVLAGRAEAHGKIQGLWPE